MTKGYAELETTSNFSFLRGGSHPEELTAQAVSLGLSAIGITDRNSVAGLVRAHSIAKEQSLQFLPGVRLVFADGTPDILAYPNGLSGWSNLTRLLTVGKRRAVKGECELFLADLLERAAGLSLIVTTANTASPSASPRKAPGSPPPSQAGQEKKPLKLVSSPVLTGELSAEAAKQRRRMV